MPAARTIGITIHMPLAAAYAFACEPDNFPRWAAGLSGALHRTARGWIAATPLGEAIVRFSDPNAYGVLDHWVSVAGKPEVYVPLRMVANGEDTLVELILFRQPDMDDAAFDRDGRLVERDLAALKALLESEPPRR